LDSKRKYLGYQGIVPIILQDLKIILNRQGRDQTIDQASNGDSLFAAPVNYPGGLNIASRAKRGRPHLTGILGAPATGTLEIVLADENPDGLPWITRSPQFHTTHWSCVLEAQAGASPDGAVALDRLCRVYWYPLYAFVRRQGFDSHDAQDLTQAFFRDLLEKRFLEGVEPGKGKFRSYLLARLKHFLENERTYRRRQKRGGGQVIFSLDQALAEERYAEEPLDDASPDRLYDRKWAQTILDQVLAKLGAEYSASGQGEWFQEMKVFLVGIEEADSYREIAARLKMSESALKSAAHRLRRRYRELFREEIAHTVASCSEIDREIKHLLGALRGGPF
jgi:RNA polymerase sigma factor (sigma-70 family)